VSTTEHTIIVTGEGKVTVKPDTASLSLGVQVTASTASEALSRANASAASLIAAKKTAGITDVDIATSGLSIYPQHNSKNAISGYQESNNVTITARDIGRTGLSWNAPSLRVAEKLGSRLDHCTTDVDREVVWMVCDRSPARPELALGMDFQHLRDAGGRIGQPQNRT
jgi:uncharacterized protein DUF541